MWGKAVMADDWNDELERRPLRFGRASKTGGWGKTDGSGKTGAGDRAGGWRLGRWLGPVAGVVLLLAGGLGWWAAPTDGAMVSAPTPAPQPDEAMARPNAGSGSQAAMLVEPSAGAALPGGDIPATARISSRGRQLLSDEQREERRFNRQDRDKDGAVSRDEFLAARRKSFDRLDKNNDGQLGFEEYAAATVARFEKADRNNDKRLTRSEFAATTPQRTSTQRIAADAQKIGSVAGGR